MTVEASGEGWALIPADAGIDVAKSSPRRELRPARGISSGGREGDVSDGALWSRVNAGDQLAFAEVYDRHATKIYNYCFRRNGDWSLAEDLMSVVFLEAWRRRNVTLAGDKVLPWLYGIASNVERNAQRSLRRYRRALSRLPRDRAEADFADESGSRLDDEQNLNRLLTGLARLPRADRETFLLCVWEELSYEDAAFALGIPVGTVKSRLARARERLREQFPADGH